MIVLEVCNIDSFTAADKHGNRDYVTDVIESYQSCISNRF